MASIILDENRESLVIRDETPWTPADNARWRNGRISQLNAALSRTQRVSYDVIRKLDSAGVKTYTLADSDNSYRFYVNGGEILVVHGNHGASVYSMGVLAARKFWKELMKAGCSRW